LAKIEVPPGLKPNTWATRIGTAEQAAEKRLIFVFLDL